MEGTAGWKRYRSGPIALPALMFLAQSILADDLAQVDWRMTPSVTEIMRWWRPASRDASMQR
jgi:hypothetical protein